MITMADERDLALAAALRQIADAMVMSAAARAGVPPGVAQVAPLVVDSAAQTVAKRKRKASAYSRAYGRAYKALRRKHTLKSGKLRKGITHKRLVKMAHAEAKKRRSK